MPPSAIAASRCTCNGSGSSDKSIAFPVSRVSSPSQSPAQRLRRWFRSGPAPEAQALVLLGLLVGAGAGAAAVVFQYLLQGTQAFFFEFLYPAAYQVVGPAAIIGIPAVGGLAAGLVLYAFAWEARGGGIAQVMQAVNQQGGRIRPIVAVVKAISTALCLGSGGSAGREGPIAQISAAIGSTIGQALGVSENRTKLLVACGVAGGIAATFNAPIAGVMFALEIILVQFNTRAFGIVVIASVTASVISRAAFGAEPAFAVPPYVLVNVGEFALYALLGVGCGILGVVFTHLLYGVEAPFEALKLPGYLKPALGGLLVGCLGLFLPEVLGTGYEPITNALEGNYGILLLLLLVAAKMAAVSFTIGSGGPGGIIGPLLFLGTMVGTAFGALAGLVLPGQVGTAGSYGLVGMAAMLAGATRAPITAVITLFEFSNDYESILPVMVAVVISTLVAEALGPDSIFTLGLRRRGIDIRTTPADDPLQTIRVADAMHTEIALAAPSLSIRDAVYQLAEARQHALVIVTENGQVEGIVTTEDLQRALHALRIEEPVAEIASRPVTTVYASEPLGEAAARMSAEDLRQVPVLDQDRGNLVVGMLHRDDIARTYSRAVLGRLQARGQAGRVISPDT